MIGTGIRIGLLSGCLASVVAAQSSARWRAHDPDRPKPLRIEPGDGLGKAPSDAVVLFDGTDLANWVAVDGSPARWAVRDGYMETVPGAGPVKTRQPLGDVQLHVEWATPASGSGSGQDRGNSGVILMGKYEIQVLDSYRNETYADGQAAAVYGQHPPLVNASRPGGAWQSYDIVFRRPRFGSGGKLITRAVFTVFHNGVLVQDRAEVWGPTGWIEGSPYQAHPDALPLLLQDHEHPVRYRNIWARQLPDLPRDEAGLAEARPTAPVSMATLRSYVGTYASRGDTVAKIGLRGGGLFIDFSGNGRTFDLVPQAIDRFGFRRTAGTVEFSRHQGEPTRLKLSVAEQVREGVRIP